MLDRKELIQQVAEYLNKNKISKKNFAAKIEVSRQTVTAWFNGKRSPSFSHCEKIIEVIKSGENGN